MASVLITGSADGLGQMAARRLVEGGHRVVLHARDAPRARDALAGVPGAAAVLTGDLSSIDAMRSVANQANGWTKANIDDGDRFDAVIHNAAVGYREPRRIETADRLPHVFAINTLAPYVLTALIRPPKRLVYLSSGLHRSGDASLADPTWRERAWDGTQAYSDSKLHDAILAAAVARRWPAVRSNALEPGWVATKMGGRGAPDDLAAGAETQVWLAVSDDPAATGSGGYFYHLKPRAALPAVHDAALQDRLLAACAALSGIPFPD